MIEKTKDVMLKSLKIQKSCIIDFNDLLFSLSEIIFSCEYFYNQYLYDSEKDAENPQNFNVKKYREIRQHELCDEKVEEKELISGLPLAFFRVLAHTVWGTMQNQVDKTVDTTEFNAYKMFYKDKLDAKFSICHVLNISTYFDNIYSMTLNDIENEEIMKDRIEEVFELKGLDHILRLDNMVVVKRDVKHRLYNACVLLEKCVMADRSTIKLLLLIINLTYLKLVNCKIREISKILEINKNVLDRLIYVIFGSEDIKNINVKNDEAYKDFYKEISKLDLSNQDVNKYLIRRTIKFVYEPLFGSNVGVCHTLFDIERELFAITKKLYSLGKSFEDKNNITYFEKSIPESEYRSRVVYNLFSNIIDKDELRDSIGSDLENYYSILFDGMELLQDVYRNKLNGSADNSNDKI